MRHTKQIFTILAALYPDARSELDFRNDYELIVSVILSAQCTDKKVNQVTPLLFGKYTNFKELANASIAALENIIRPINYYKTKAKNLKALGEKIISDFHGRIPDSLEDLITLPGVGRKTANVVLSETGKRHSLPVDTHVLRLSNRLGLSKGSTPDAVEKDLMKLYPSKDWRALHHRLIYHGRRVCIARSPKCGECHLKKICPSAS